MTHSVHRLGSCGWGPLRYHANMRRFPGAIAVVVICAMPGKPDAATDPTLGQRVAAIFMNRCSRCHGPSQSMADLRLDSYDGVMRGSDRGPVLVPGDPAKSLLMQKVLRRDRPPMPPRKRLPRKEIKTIRAWIRAGALP